MMNLVDYRKQHGQPTVGQLVYVANHRYDRWTLSRVVKVTPSGLVDVAQGHKLVDPLLAGVPKLKEGCEPTRFNKHGTYEEGRYDYNVLDFDIEGVKASLDQRAKRRDLGRLFSEVEEVAMKAKGHTERSNKESLNDFLSGLKSRIADAERLINALA